MLMSLLALVACELTPPNVERSDIDDALLAGRMKTVCKGLEMPQDEVRTYAAEKLEAYDQDPALGAECICARAVDERTGLYDAAILAGIRDTQRDDLVACFLPSLDDPRTGEELLSLVVGLSQTRAPALRPTMLALARDGARDTAVRARAVGYFAGTTDRAELDALIALLQSDGDEAVRAAAADALSGQKGEAEVAALVAAATGDAAGAVRARALMALKKARVPEYDEMICRAMMEDESPEVRRQAVMSYRGTKRSAAIACVRERALTEEEDGGVRAAVLKVLGSSPSDAAARALCDAIPFWVQHYVDKIHPDKQPENDIITAQNNRDWENSYDCVARAYGMSHRYTCKGQQYVGAWFRELGNKGAFVPKCGEGGGGAEVIMEGTSL